MKLRAFHITAFIIFLVAIILSWTFAPDLQPLVILVGVIAAPVFFLMEDAQTRAIAEGSYEPPVVDVWNLQRGLMEASGQELPNLPTITPHSLTYLALTAEELAETMRAMVAILNVPAGRLPGIVNMISEEAAELEVFSSALRLALANPATQNQFPKSPWPAPDHLVVDFLDGTTDLAVVVAGLGLASGLPNGPAYEEVVGSNLSKADPRTGKIKLDPSGKWIKDSQYAAPDLVKVLSKQRADLSAGL